MRDLTQKDLQSMLGSKARLRYRRFRTEKKGNVIYLKPTSISVVNTGPEAA